MNLDLVSKFVSAFENLWSFKVGIGIFMVSSFGGHLYAVDRNSPTFKTTVDGGLSTYKSQFVNSNDTSTYLGMTFSITGGMEKNIEALIITETINTTFELNTSKIEQSNQNTLIRYYLGPAYLGLGLNQATLITNKESTDTVDGIATGTVMNLGMKFSVNKGDTVFLDVRSITTGVVKDVRQSDVALGSRMDINLGGSIRITKKLIDARIGYKQSTFSYTLSGASTQESISTTWVGLGMNFFF